MNAVSFLLQFGNQRLWKPLPLSKTKLVGNDYQTHIQTSKRFESSFGSISSGGGQHNLSDTPCLRPFLNKPQNLGGILLAGRLKSNNVLFHFPPFHRILLPLPDPAGILSSKASL